MEVDRTLRYADASQVTFDLRHPEQVSLGAHLSKPESVGFFARIRRLFAKPSEKAMVGPARGSAGKSGPAIVLAAVDLMDGADALAEEVLTTTGRVLASRPDSLLSCLTVLKTEILADTPDADSEGRSIYVKRLVALRDWARPLRLPDHRISYHVVEAVSPAEAILAYAERNDVGHIVIGARASSAIRRHLGSVSAKVVAEAHCSVSVVRLKVARSDEAAE
jgi:nucleotide-binding universal stress UspA family protein